MYLYNFGIKRQTHNFLLQICNNKKQFYANALPSTK